MTGKMRIACASPRQGLRYALQVQSMFQAYCQKYLGKEVVISVVDFERISDLESLLRDCQVFIKDIWKSAEKNGSVGWRDIATACSLLDKIKDEIGEIEICSAKAFDEAAFWEPGRNSGK